MEEEKKYVGYGYHGGGRKKMSESGRKSLQISLQQNEVEKLKELAKDAGMSVSEFVRSKVFS